MPAIGERALPQFSGLRFLLRGIPRLEQREHTLSIDGGRARLRAVDIGARNAEEVEIRTGLGSGEQVVIFPGESLTDGQRVTITVAPIGR